MAKYAKNNKTLKCPKCGSIMSLESDHGSFIWVCPVHGTNWIVEKEEVKSTRR